MPTTVFDESERLIWAGRGPAYADSFAKLCAYPVPRLLDAAGVGAGVRVLDVGTGSGTVAAAACARGATVTAVDAEPTMVELARLAAPEADVRLAVLPDLPYADAEFDAVVANFVLNHVGRPMDTLAELRRVVRPGGWIALTIWAAPPAAGQTLIGRAIQAAGAVRPPHLPAGLAAEDDFRRDETGHRRSRHRRTRHRGRAADPGPRRPGRDRRPRRGPGRGVHQYPPAAGHGAPRHPSAHDRVRTGGHDRADQAHAQAQAAGVTTPGVQR